ncbi:MAG: prephenate dehydratase [Thermoleophilia bacterium]
MRVGYLGPPGTFSEEALLALRGGDGALEEIPFPTVVDCFRAVRDGEVPEALVPIENTIEGSVNQTLDQLAAGGGLCIRAEVVLPVRHHLIARGPIDPSEVERVLSHPHATAQCQGFLRARAPGATIVATNSTADAVRIVGGGGNGGPAAGPRDAAIGTLRAAELYGCEVLETDIADAHDNSTRFVMLGRDPAEAIGAGRFRTSIICALQRDRPGALLAILQEFAMRAVNLTRLESRPTKTGLGSYIFFIDIEGSRERDLPVASAIQALEDQGVADVTFLGSYRADGGPG